MTDAELREARTALADLVERFARTEIAPHVTEWDAAGEFPRALYRRAAELGLLGMGYPEEFGGTPAPHALRMVMWRALCRFGTSGGVQASLLSHNIGLPPVVALASDAVKREVVPPVLAGEKIAALAITEPGGGSDVAAVHTTARREGDEYVVDGEKIFITSGMRADWITVAVRTNLQSKGSSGLSLLLVPGDSKGLSRTRLDKMGWLCSDTAQLRFDGVRVPARYLLGAEGAGFKAIMGNFNGERFGIAAGALGFAEACYDEALAWAQQRKTFGQALVGHQVIRHKLVDMQQHIRATAAWLEQLAARADAGDTGADWVGEVAALKNQATQTLQFCADAGVQILGGMGYMRGTVCERIYREVKVITIGGGTEEIMKELAARQWGIV
ncbi:acyl-CoA dehydrogenase family protein [Ottowia sp.]|uniref:acyl-CoA dehydrogenase family protein n=1 Tax=Ottowia sp. TaxID=1898956 RepID=UPI002BC16476|nr:acyl-CoA dehydrogenase family protein [Ottowia sp.]